MMGHHRLHGALIRSSSPPLSMMLDVAAAVVVLTHMGPAPSFAQLHGTLGTLTCRTSSSGEHKWPTPLENTHDLWTWTASHLAALCLGQACVQTEITTTTRIAMHTSMPYIACEAHSRQRHMMHYQALGALVVARLALWRCHAGLTTSHPVRLRADRFACPRNLVDPGPDIQGIRVAMAGGANIIPWPLTSSPMYRVTSWRGHISSPTRVRCSTVFLPPDPCTDEWIGADTTTPGR